MKPNRKKISRTARDDDNRGVHEPETTPAEERGERLNTGKAIARGGKDEGRVPGAEPAGMHPEPPDPEERKRQAVSDALTRLGELADPVALASEVRTHSQIDLSPEEADRIRAELIG